MGDGELQDAGERDAEETQQNGKIQANLLAENANAFRAAEQAIELIEDADAASGECGESGAGDAEFRKWTPAENETRVEDEVDDVRDPEQAAWRWPTSPAPRKMGVGVEKKQHDNAAAAERDVWA